MSDSTNRIAAYLREEITRSHARTKRAVEEDAAARGMSNSGPTAGAIKGLDEEMDRLMSFVGMAEEAAGGNALALLQTPPPIPLSWRLTPLIPIAAGAVARAFEQLQPPRKL